MGSEAEAEQDSNIPKLPLFSVPAMQIQMEMQSPERPGTSASVPFRWEQEPGKPRLCNALVTFTNPTNKCLELPPRLLSTTTVLHSPHVTSSRFRSPSFRIEDNSIYNCYGSSSTDTGLFGTMVLVKGDNGWFGSWRKKVKRDINGSSHVFPSSSTGTIAETSFTHNNNNMVMKRSGSSSSLSHGKTTVWVSFNSFFMQCLYFLLPYVSAKFISKC